MRGRPRSPATRPRRRRSAGSTRVACARARREEHPRQFDRPGRDRHRAPARLWADAGGRTASSSTSSASSSGCRTTTSRARALFLASGRGARRSPARISSSTPGSRRRASCSVSGTRGRWPTVELLDNVVKAYGDNAGHPRHRPCDRSGEFVVFVGPSGCGKSTLLRMIAGLEDDHRRRDRHRRHGRERASAARARHRDGVPGLRAVPAQDGVREHGVRAAPAQAARAEIRARVGEAAAILQIDHLLERKPRELSGGQRQRVAMGRAIVRQPKAFLFDEPLCNLDALLRAEMRVEIKKLHQKLGNTIIYVTHDQVEAMTLADRIVVLQAGNLDPVRHAGRDLQPAGREVRRRFHGLAADELPAVRASARAGARCICRAARRAGAGRARGRMRAACGPRVDVRLAARAHQRRRVGASRGAHRSPASVMLRRAAGLRHARPDQARAPARTQAR